MTKTFSAAMLVAMENTEWQQRAKAAGLDQETLRRILGLTKSGVSQGIRGKWESGVPQPIKAAIVAWELMTLEQRTAWVGQVQLVAGKKEEE